MWLSMKRVNVCVCGAFVCVREIEHVALHRG